MKIAGLALAAVVVLATVVGAQVIARAHAQPIGPMPMPVQMQGGMMTGQQMDAMMAQMQAHMVQMTARVRASLGASMRTRWSLNSATTL